MQEKNIETLVINKVENQKVYDAMVAANKINSNELYLVGGGEQVTGVKGDKETVFRAGDVNLTASNIGALAEDTPVIKYTEQNLDDNQKTQARTNIGAGTSSFSGQYNDLTGTPPIVYKNSATVISSPVDIVYDSKNTLGIRINPSYRNSLLKISQRDDGFGINLETNSTTNEGAVIINGVATPTDNNHAANKKYVDDAIANNTVDISDATTDTSGLMSAADKVKLNAIEEGANKTTVDGALNSTSTNPVQNKVINTKLTTMQSDIDSKVNKDGNKVLSTNDFTTALKNNLNSAYTHSTSDHAPSNAERNTIVTIKRNGTALTPTDRVVDIIVPTKTSDLTNDSDFATNSSVDGKLDGKVDKVTGKGLSTNDLTNALKGNYDAAYTHSTSSHAPANAERNTIATIKKNGTALSPDSSRAINITVPTKVSELTNDSGYLTSVPVTSVNSKTGAVSLTASDVGAAPSSHTHNYAGSSSAGGAATSANKVNKSMTVKLNGGTTEGTNQFTFDGSAAKSVNITPSGIGAAASSHTHSYLPLSGGTLTGNLTGKYITGTLLQTTAASDKVGKIATIDDNGWIYYRTLAETKGDLGISDNLVKYDSNTTVEATTKVNADTLEGHATSYFVPKSGGAMTGALVAQTNTNYTTAQMRNVIISTADPSGGNNGDIWLKYEA